MRTAVGTVFPNLSFLMHPSASSRANPVCAS